MPHVFTSFFYGETARRQKIDGLTIPWAMACRRPNFPPVRAAFLSLWPTAEPIFPVCEVFRKKIGYHVIKITLMCYHDNIIMLS
jgi:hypothetical protein